MSQINDIDAKNFAMNFFNEIDKILGKQIMNHLHIFFSKSIKNKTRKNISRKNRTKRRYYTD